MAVRHLVRSLFVALGLAIGVAAPSAAQVFTSPFMAPRAGSSAGVYLSDFGEDLAVEGILRSRFGGLDLGFRGGVVDLGDTHLTLGAELRNPLTLGTAPVDVAFTAGLQALVGDADFLGVQAGLSVGHTFVSDGFSFTPYVHPRIALIDGPIGDSETDVLADLGADFDFTSRLSLRLSIGLDDRSPDWGIGLAWR